MSKEPEKKQEVETTGHSWDGIQEYNNPLPRWWLWCFYGTIVWGVIYTIAFPAWPLINGATPGILGFSTRAEVAAEIARVEERNSGLDTELASANLATLASDNPELHRYAVNGGAAVFNTWCVQCHGREGGLGAKGYPVLSDNDWLWGGSIEEIQYSIAHGIRNDTDDAHYSEMPAFGEILEEEEIEGLVNYVLSLSGADHDAALAAGAAESYLDNCSACHGEEGLGDKYQGAPNLADAIWLYGGDADDVRETIIYSRYGVMPNWNERLSEANIAAVAAYVHQLGGGEQSE